MISIIIPAHNEEKYIEETLKNINNLSTDKDQFEVLVIENGSTDRTLEIANLF
ncbi:MAG: glycosyltransferase, partial [bacterium]